MGVEIVLLPHGTYLKAPLCSLLGSEVVLIYAVLSALVEYKYFGIFKAGPFGLSPKGPAA